VSDRQNDKDDWSSDSASLFRAARRAHDPTPLERARLDAVLTRIQAGSTGASPEASGPPISARGVTPEMLRQVAKLSLAILCVAVVSIAVMRVNRQPSKPTPTEQPAPRAVASSPTPIAIPPAPVPSAERGESPQAPEARDEGESQSRSHWRRVRAQAAKQRSTRMSVASVPEASDSAIGEGTPGVTSRPNDAPQSDRSKPAAAVRAATSLGAGAAQRTASFESGTHAEMTPAARIADPQSSREAHSELALLKRMQAALREGDFSTALASCAEHEQRWPHGTFEMEREGVRAIASCGANTADAPQRAKGFLAAHPHAPVAMRVRSACTSYLPRR